MKPSPQCLANELDWMFLHLDPNPIFQYASETIKELYIENEMLRRDRGHIVQDRPIEIQIKWSD